MPFEIEFRTESGARLGDDRAGLAYLAVSYQGPGEARRAYARVAKIVRHATMTLNEQTRPYSQRLYRNLDIFLKWEASDTRYHDFEKTARLHVAFARGGEGRYRLETVETPPLSPWLHTFDSYEITSEIAADNVPALRKTLLLRMEESERAVSLHGVPPKVYFREWAESDRHEGEIDLDAMREERGGA